MKRLFLIAILVLVPWNFAMSQPPEESSAMAAARDAGSAASGALGTLRALVNEQNARSYGFTSTDEARSATLGTPLPIAFVRLDELREYSASRDPAGLLHAANQVLVPIRASGQVRSSIVMERSQEGWEAVSFGGPNLARMLSEARMAAARESGVSEEAITAVHVAALGRYYVMSHRDEQLVLTAVTDDPELQFRAGQSRPASEVFASLVPIARAYNEEPM